MGRHEIGSPIVIPSASRGRERVAMPSACGPPANTLWLFGCVHKSGTSWLSVLSRVVLPQGAHMLEYATGKFSPQWEDAPAHACKSPDSHDTSHWPPHPDGTSWSVAASALLSPACVGTALRNGGVLRWRSMGLDRPPRLQPAVGEGRAAPRLRVLVMARAPLQIVLSGYFYHQKTQELWAVTAPYADLPHLRMACERAWPAAPPADACAAAMRLLRREKNASSLSYQQLLKELPADIGVLVEASRSLNSLRRQHATLRTLAPSQSAPLAAWVQDLDEIAAAKRPEYAATVAGILCHLGVTDAVRCAHVALSQADAKLDVRARLPNGSIHVFDPHNADTKARLYGVLERAGSRPDGRAARVVMDLQLAYDRQLAQRASAQPAGTTPRRCVAT